MLEKIDLKRVMKNLDSFQQMGRKRFTKLYLMGKLKGEEITVLNIQYKVRAVRAVTDRLSERKHSNTCAFFLGSPGLRVYV